MTGGLLIWAGQFIGVYLISSMADVAATAEDSAWSLAGVVFSAACLAGIVALGVWAARMKPADQLRAFERSLAVGACVLGGIGVVFQTLPLALSLMAGQA